MLGHDHELLFFRPLVLPLVRRESSVARRAIRNERSETTEPTGEVPPNPIELEIFMAGNGTRIDPGGAQLTEYVTPIVRPDRSTMGVNGDQLSGDQQRVLATHAGVDASGANSAQPAGVPLLRPLNES